MHDIKYIRNNPSEFEKEIKKRNVKIDLNKILELDKINRSLIQKKETLESEKKKISKTNDKSLFEKSKKLSAEIEKLNNDQDKIDEDLNSILSNIPNIALNDVPIGLDDKSNVEIKKIGTIPSFNFEPKPHYVLGENLNMLDFNLATKTSGSRFVFMKDKLALLERALNNFMLDTHIYENGYKEISPPLLVNENSMFGTGQLPKFENDQFELKMDLKSDKKYLIPTAEVILTNMVRENIVNFKDLPMRFVASTPCFRKEAGSYGKDTKGMIRQHQFHKVELVSIVEPENCVEELDRMTNSASKILDKLKLPYRIVSLSTGDMGFSAQKTFDIEVYLPSEKKYREISSCSTCGTFQARRMKAKYKTKNNEKLFLGTLNGSGLAIGRTLIAILENYQNEDGNISIPEILRPYMKNLELLT